MLMGVGFQVATGKCQQRPHQAPLRQGAMLRHSRQPSYTGATQQAKQQGFGLIVAMLASEKHLPTPRTCMNAW